MDSWWDPSIPLRYWLLYKPMKPDPKHGPFVGIRFSFSLLLTAVEQDRSTITLLKQFDEVSFAAGDAFLDMANIFQRLTLAQEGRYPSFTPSLDQLLSHYMHLMDTTNRAHEACAKYLFSCRSAWDPTDPNFNGQAHVDDAFAELRKLCGEVRTSVADASAQWDKTAHDVRSLLERDLPIPSPLKWLVGGVAPGCVVARRLAVFADLPTLQETAKRNLHRLAHAYKTLEATTLTDKEAVTGAPADTKAANERCRNLKILISALIRLDFYFTIYRDCVNDQSHNWPPQNLYQTPLRMLLVVEGDYVANEETYYVKWLRK